MSYSLIRVERQLDQPLDTVQQIIWDRSDRTCRTFLTCGWDGYVRAYEIEGTNLNRKLEKKWHYYFHHPITTMDLTADRLVIVGLATGQIGLVDMKNVNNVLLLGSHAAPICKVVWVEKYEVVVTFGYDCLIKVFTLKPQNQNSFQVSEYKLPTKTFTASFSHPYFLIGSQDSKIAVINVQKIGEVNFSKEYQMIFDESHGLVKFTTSSINSARGRILLGTADGRMVCTNFTDSPSGGIRINKPVISRYQKKNSYRKEMVGQMNCIDFVVKDNKYEYVVFCGTEEMGTFSPEKNVKIKPIGPTSQVCTTAISISPDCQHYAFAQGADWSRGLEELGTALAVKVVVGRLSPSDIMTPISSYIR